ncbi:diguanylate cyclase [Undibacterium arcticum]|uniref:diguanylate cyclase n=1 Tax=Undibacterium arcticum TaxID=1762892 RepID=UPI00361CDB9F
MDMFALDDEVTRLEFALSPLRGLPRLAVLEPLAWHLRQRDTGRALALADEAEALLATCQREPDRQRIAARLRLVRSEAEWMWAKLDAAQEMADPALRTFSALDDAAGIADAHWLQALIAADRGDHARRDAELEAAASQARRAGDDMRARIAEAASAIWTAYRDLVGAQQRWGRRFEAELADLHPAVAPWVHDFLGLVAAQSSDFGTAAAHFLRTRDTALATGQVRRAINAGTNVGSCFTSLNDHEAALEWMQRSLELARPCGWPLSIGVCLIQTTEALRSLGRLDAAQELMVEALDTLAPLASSRTYAIALQYSADLALDRGHHTLALDSFRQLEQRAESLNQVDFQIESRRGQAHALSHLGRPQESLQAAHAALALAQRANDAAPQVRTLRVLADIHARHSLPTPDGVAANGAPLHYLQQALAVAATIDDYTVPGELFDALAREHASLGDYAEAYDSALRANAVRESTRSLAATNRAIAMQVQQATERARADAEHHRQLASSEAKRAETLQQTGSTLERLSAIGQEITTHLDAKAVFKALDRHVHGLLDVSSLIIYLLDADAQGLNAVFGVENGKALPAFHVALSSPTSNSARCVRERREILVDLTPDDDNPNRIPGTLPILSALFTPLLIGDRILGAMSIQSPQPQVYGEREQLILRTLCAFGAIALDNAATYRQLTATLKTLHETRARVEEMSLTDSLTGLRNRRFLLQHVETDVAMNLRRYDEWQKHPEQPLPEDADLIFILIDLDDFKSVNDTYGHAAGDQVLEQMRERLETVFRESDYLIRWGGEEFLVVARAANRADAEAVSERVRAVVADRVFELADGLRLAKTCSIGFACLPFLPAHPRLLTWAEVVELADKALYLAKDGGRNAWAGFFGTELTPPDVLFPWLLQNAEPATRDGMLRLVSSMDLTVKSAAGSKV